MTPATIDVLTLPCLPLGERKALPLCPALYFVLNVENAIVYIGRTKSLQQRWIAHHKGFRESEGLRIAWLSVDDPVLLSSIETACIAYFDPPLNGDQKRHEPRPEYVSVSLRLSKELLNILREEARREHRSVRAQIEVILEPWIEARRRKKADRESVAV